jgi:L-iditol 2-dehydrogenase
MGADICLNTDIMCRKERLAVVKDLTGGRGADVIIECAGTPEALNEGFDLLRVGGMYIELGNFVDVGSSKFSPNKEICTKKSVSGDGCTSSIIR